MHTNSMQKPKSIELIYNSTLEVITTRIKKGQFEALKAVNKELIELYRDIGRIISQSKDEASWGDTVISQLAKDICSANPGIRGFSRSNIFNMVRFYETYKDNQKVQSLTGLISWTHNVLILNKCELNEERVHYIKMTIRYGWSSRLLMNKIDFKDYQRSINSQSNFDLTVEEEYKDQAKLTIKDEYIFNLLELGEEHSEKELEDSIIQNLERFLIELDHSLLFVGRQYKLEVGEGEYFIDLLLYQRFLKCFVAIELKVGEFKPEYAGKMSFYLTALDKQVKSGDENKSIGIIICKQKDKTVVEYALTDVDKPMAVATYKSHEELPKMYAKHLPTEQKIADKLFNIIN